MTNAEPDYAEYVKRTDAFIDAVFDLLVETKPVNFDAGRQMVRIAQTLDDVPYVDLANLATVNRALHGFVGRARDRAQAHGRFKV